MKRNLAVFGASGKIGTVVTKRLLEAGHSVTALQHRRPVPEGCRVIEGAVTDDDAVRRVIGDNEIVLQLATSKGDRDRFLDVAVGGTFRVLDAIHRRGGAEQFVLAGGDAALGIWSYRHTAPLTEASPLRAYPGYYALSKVLEETLACQYGYQYGIPYTILRMGWIHSPDTLLSLFLAGAVAGRCWTHMFRDAMPPALHERAAGAGPGFVFVAVDQASGIPIRRTTCSYEDAAQAWELAIGNPLARDQVFNVVHPAWDYAQVGAFLAQRLQVPTERVPVDAHSWEMETTKIRSMLGWKPRDDIFGMLERALSGLA